MGDLKKLSDYVGDHGGRYTDIDGMSKQFTYVDHDKKTTISASVSEEGQNETYDEFFIKYRASLIRRITDMPASICPEIFSDYTLRGEGRNTIQWNTDMLLDAGVPLKQLRDICVILENKAELMRLTP